ncbi:MAG: metallophosphoesterase [Thermodesulfobacteriota bacterium]|nr:metallophosphoesterase [Thermodesulfobacteriota bacterium]
METFDHFWIGFGDIHDDAAKAREIPGLNRAEAVIISGDLTTHGGPAQAKAVLGTVADVNPKIWAQIGNMDRPEIESLLEDRGMNIHVKGFELAPGIGIMGVGTSSPTPFGTPSEYPDTQLAAWLARAYERVRDFERLLLVAHDPPRGTKTDRLPSGQHVGSLAVREFIERVQPEICLTGHIHEAKAEDFIGRTKVINPGMLSQGGYVVIGLKDNELVAELRTL